MNYRIFNKPGFIVAGRSRKFTTTNGLNFIQIPLWWDEFVHSRDFEKLIALSGNHPGAMTGGVMLGVDFGSPPATWAVFECTLDNIRDTYKYIFSEWLPSSGYKHDAVPHIEVYLPERPRQKMKCELWIPIIKKKL